METKSVKRVVLGVAVAFSSILAVVAIQAVVGEIQNNNEKVRIEKELEKSRKIQLGIDSADSQACAALSKLRKVPPISDSELWAWQIVILERSAQYPNRRTVVQKNIDKHVENLGLFFEENPDGMKNVQQSLLFLQNTCGKLGVKF